MFDAKRLPEVAAARKTLADGLRKARKENPALARLLLRRIRRATETAVEGMQK